MRAALVITAFIALSIADVSAQTRTRYSSIVSYLPPTFNQREAPISNQRITPISNIRVAPISNQRRTPISNLRVAPISNQRITLISNLRVAPISNQREAPISNQREAPISNQREAPISDQREAPISNQREAPISNQSEAPISNQQAPISNQREIVKSADNYIPREYKHVYVHSAPDDVGQPEKRVIRVNGGDKHTNIIFVKAPSQSSQSQTEVVLPEPDQQKNIVYVLLQNKSANDNIKITRPQPTAPVKPEVHFIRYDDAGSSASPVEQAPPTPSGLYGTPAGYAPPPKPSGLYETPYQ